MARGACNTVINRPAEEIFAFITNPVNLARVMDNTTLKTTSENPLVAGSQFVVVNTKDSSEIEYEVVEYELNKKLRYRGLTQEAVGDTSYTFTPLPTGTKVIFAYESEVTGFIGFVAGLLMGGALSEAACRALKKIKEFLGS